MARLQVLHLPDQQTGPDEFERRFALVVDELDGPMSDGERTDLDAFAAQIGASGVYATDRTVDCDQGDGAEVEEFAARLRELVDERIGQTVQATMAQEPKRGYATLAQQLLDEQKKPVEPKPKVTRTWGTVERDPREGIPGWPPDQAAQAETVDAIQRAVDAQGGAREVFRA